MAAKKYEQQESKPLQVNKPVTAYQKQDADVYRILEQELASVMRAKEQYVRGECIAHEEFEKRVKGWLN